MDRRITKSVYLAALVIGLLIFANAASAAPPVVKTVPWVSTNALVPHDTWSGKTITLKGTADVQGAGITYSWDFGDGSPVATGNVTNKYVIEAKHAYTGIAGTVFTARLTVQNTGTGETGNKEYYVKLQTQSLPIEVNVAIDEGLWYLHKDQYRFTSGGVDYGQWTSGQAGGYASSGYYSVTAANINAFEVNGHLQTGSPDNPYTETVTRGLKSLFTFLAWGAIGNQTNPLGTFNTDSNGNGIGIYANQYPDMYQDGIFMDAIVASGTPDALATTGPANVIGRKFKDIVQDMADWYAYGQYDSSPQGGGWRYQANQGPDNSPSQWAAIGLIAAQHSWGTIVPAWLKDWNKTWLVYSQHPTGYFGYTDMNPIWGPYATTPSGMVQLVMDGIGRGVEYPAASGKFPWDKAETYIRDNFGNTGSAYYNIKAYYYGLFSFVKSMLLHNVNGVAQPITNLQSKTAGVPPIDWYAAETSKGAPTNGVARTLVNDQNTTSGYWFGHNYTGDQYYFETAFAIIMLNRTLFEAGAPVAVAKATPNPGIVGQVITLDGGDSFHQDPTKHIVQWDWDLDNNGTYEKPGVVVTNSWGALGDYPVGLRVTDDSSPAAKTATTVVTVRITTPPVAPTSNAGGPYNFCPGAKPWFLDGTKSSNPDEGQHQAGPYPGDTIYPPTNPNGFLWDLDADAQFDDASGPQPDVTAFFSAKPAGSYLIYLKVTDTTASSFPGSGMGNLSNTSTAEVQIRSATDPACTCVSDLTARPKLNKAELRWTSRAGAVSYNIYRGTVSGGPYIKIASVGGAANFYLDAGPLTLNATYYWVVREAALNGTELCQSNQAAAKMTGR